MWDLTVSVPDHCLSFYFIKVPLQGFVWLSTSRTPALLDDHI